MRRIFKGRDRFVAKGTPSKLPTLRWSAKRTVAVVVVGLNLLLVARLVATWTRDRLAISEERLPYGHQLAGPTRLTLATALPQRWITVILVFPKHERLDRLKHLAILAKQYSDHGIALVTVGSRVSVPTGHPLREFPHIEDERSTIHRELHVSDTHQHGGLVLFDGAYRVIFRSVPIPGDDAIRQLVERQALGVVNYAPADATVNAYFSRGDAVPDLPLRHILSGQRANLPAIATQGTLLVVFSAPCSSCQLESFLSELRSILERRGSFAPDTARPKTAVLLSEGFDDTAVRSHLRRGELPADTYEFSRVDAPDQVAPTRYVREALRPTLVAIGKGGVIQSIRPLRFVAAR